jgi:hypothetical protein
MSKPKKEEKTIMPLRLILTFAPIGILDLG